MSTILIGCLIGCWLGYSILPLLGGPRDRMDREATELGARLQEQKRQRREQQKAAQWAAVRRLFR